MSVTFFVLEFGLTPGDAANTQIIIKAGGVWDLDNFCLSQRPLKTVGNGKRWFTNYLRFFWIGKRMINHVSCFFRCTDLYHLVPLGWPHKLHQFLLAKLLFLKDVQDGFGHSNWLRVKFLRSFFQGNSNLDPSSTTDAQSVVFECVCIYRTHWNLDLLIYICIILYISNK